MYFYPYICNSPKQKNMRNLLFIILATLTLTSCDYRSQKMMTVCNCEQKKDLRDFIQSSIKNANNMSDEEMEDVIYELRRTGLKVICDEKMIDATFSGNSHNMIKQHTVLDSCEAIVR